MHCIELQDKRKEFRLAMAKLPWQRRSLEYSYGMDFMTIMEEPTKSTYWLNLTKIDKIITELIVLEDKSILSTKENFIA